MACTKMDDQKTYFYVLLLLNIIAVSSYLQFVVPGVTEADSSPVHVSIIDSVPYPYWPNRTVDGNFSQNIRACLHTAALTSISEAWLRIDLKTVRSIKYVKFWYRNDRGSPLGNTMRLWGYSIRVSNNSDVPPASTDVCFTDNKTHILPTVIQEECKKSTRYIWFYQMHFRDYFAPILEICEVMIYGCETGKYDTSCSKTCSHCMNNETCDIDTGECDYNGCALPGFESPLCSACRPGIYGRSCQLRCSNHCYNNEVCDPFFGNCSKCADGFQNAKCDEQCDGGYYGKRCMFQCGDCLDDKACNNINGTCPSGCMSGWQNTEKCEKPCRNGTFGVGCMHECSGNCLNNETCDKKDGGCRNCDHGFEGHLCNKTCDIGHYGINCQHVCGQCYKAEQCFYTNGSCSGGCMEGYRGDMCTESRDPDTLYVAVIAALVAIIVILIAVITVPVVVRNTCKKRETNSQINEVNMYDLPYEKPESSEYNVIFAQ
eukprot:XP_011432728.1 PREDICTED: multiple epidermal growth factor-like domains protein 10 isoform X1 [Crassostrea gigas]